MPSSLYKYYRCSFEPHRKTFRQTNQIGTCDLLFHCSWTYTKIWWCSNNLYESPKQVYFGMLDILLAEEKIPEEYSGRTQVC